MPETPRAIGITWPAPANWQVPPGQSPLDAPGQTHTNSQIVNAIVSIIHPSTQHTPYNHHQSSELEARTFDSVSAQHQRVTRHSQPTCFIIHQHDIFNIRFHVVAEAVFTIWLQTLILKSRKDVFKNKRLLQRRPFSL